MIFCAEQYKYAKKLTGRQLDELFSKYRVWDYLYACYEALHTTGTNYIIHDIDLYIDARKPAMAQTDMRLHSDCKFPICEVRM